MPRKSNKMTVDERSLKKGELRKLNALRKSLGDEIAERAFREWYSSARELHSAKDADQNLELIGDALNDIRDSLKFPRGGAYIVKQGRGRVIVEPAWVQK